MGSCSDEECACCQEGGGDHGALDPEEYGALDRVEYGALDPADHGGWGPEESIGSLMLP